MVSMADPVVRRKPRVYLCPICDKPVSAAVAVYSTFTRRRFHPLCTYGKKGKEA